MDVRGSFRWRRGQRLSVSSFSSLYVTRMLTFWCFDFRRRAQNTLSSSITRIYFPRDARPASCTLRALPDRHCLSHSTLRKIIVQLGWLRHGRRSQNSFAHWDTTGNRETEAAEIALRPTIRRRARTVRGSDNCNGRVVERQMLEAKRLYVNGKTKDRNSDRNALAIQTLSWGWMAVYRQSAWKARKTRQSRTLQCRNRAIFHLSR